MKLADAATVQETLDYSSLIEALRTGFKDGCVAPLRHHHTIGVPKAPDATLLLMPAWTMGGFLGVKVATVFPGNVNLNRPAVSAVYYLANASTGEALALIDGGELTARRTAAASALASSYLSRVDASHLLIVGTGRLARHLAQAHPIARPSLRRITIWGRHIGKARALASDLSKSGFSADATSDLATAVREADLISSATLAQEPLIRGEWLQPGQHLDLVGGFTPAMREADDEAVRRSKLFVDTIAGASKEAGDIVQTLAAGLLREDELVDLAMLARGAPGRTSPKEITLFKSVGMALEDLIAATLVFKRLQLSDRADP